MDDTVNTNWGIKDRIAHTNSLAFDGLQVIIYGSFGLPTLQQILTAAFVCQLFSNLYQPIQVFRYDQRFKTIYMQAGVNDDIALVVDEDGSSEFVL